MEEQRRKNGIEFIKYTMVGLSSTVIQYMIYVVCFSTTENYIFANSMGFIISVGNSYFWNRRVVFHSMETAIWWKVLLKNYMLYFGTGVVATNLLSYALIDRLRISPYLSPLLIVLLLYPINYLLNKYWAHKKENACGSNSI